MPISPISATRTVSSGRLSLPVERFATTMREMPSMNPVLFFVFSAIIVGTAAIAVIAPRVITAAKAAVAMWIASGLLCAVSGAYAVALVELVAPSVALIVMLWLVKESGERSLLHVPRKAHEWTPIVIAGAVVVSAGIGLVVVFLRNADGWHHGTGVARLITIFHYRLPTVVVAVIVMMAVAIGGSVVIRRISDDELSADAHREAERKRTDRIRQRQDDRLRAKNARRASTERES